MTRGWHQGGGQLPPPLNFSLSENFGLVSKLSSKNTTFGAENPPFWGTPLSIIRWNWKSNMLTVTPPGHETYLCGKS